MSTRAGVAFPRFEDSKARAYIADVARLLDASLIRTKYIDAPAASRLLSQIISGYKTSIGDKAWKDDPFLRRASDEGNRFGLLLAAAFDLVCNAEYVRGRVGNSKWIYCHRSSAEPVAYYSFLKQCPLCCLDLGLEKRIAGAQHKPGSHQIGEITTTVATLLVQLIAEGSARNFAVATVTKQSHDVDAVGFSDDVLVLFEIKASPLVSFPLRVALPRGMYADEEGERKEYEQHSLVDIVINGQNIDLFVPHREWALALGPIAGADWPYGPMLGTFADPALVLKYFSAWLELYYAYAIPKRKRDPRNQSLTYLVNGWGDEIDSNKTKPGLGRTDDIKKGTYQLIKFGAYYRDDHAATKVRGGLVANLDPMFLRAPYMDGIIDVRWAREPEFEPRDGGKWIPEDRLRYLYDAVVAFNQPVVNDPILQEYFQIERAEDALLSGGLDGLLQDWAAGKPGVELKVPKVKLSADEQRQMEALEEAIDGGDDSQ